MVDDNQLNASNLKTALHIMEVSRNLNFLACELLHRSDKHDQSKMEEPEAEAFALVTEKLAGVTYGSSEYDKYKTELGEALKHHYANNRHHPEHYKHGIKDMNLVDICEMFCDWRASSMRHNDGNIRKSIEHNAVRFHMSDDLVKIFENTADLFDE